MKLLTTVLPRRDDYDISRPQYPSALKAVLIIVMTLDLALLCSSVIFFVFFFNLYGTNEGTLSVFNGTTTYTINCLVYPQPWLSATFAFTVLSEIVNVITILLLLFGFLCASPNDILGAFLAKNVHVVNFILRLGLIISLLGTLGSYSGYKCFDGNGHFIFTEVFAINIVQVILAGIWGIFWFVLLAMPLPERPVDQTTRIPKQLDKGKARDSEELKDRKRKKQGPPTDTPPPPGGIIDEPEKSTTTEQSEERIADDNDG